MNAGAWDAPAKDDAQCDSFIYGPANARRERRVRPQRSPRRIVAVRPSPLWPSRLICRHDRSREWTRRHDVSRNRGWRGVASGEVSDIYSRAMSSSSSRQSNTAPERSLGQRMDALGRANDVRSRRAALKSDLKHGVVSIRDVLAAPPEFLLTAKVVDLLMAAPKCGRVKSAKIMEQCRVSPSKTIGGLSERQRTELLAYFGG